MIEWWGAPARAQPTHTAGGTAMPRNCSIDGCGRLHVARGYCGAHWRRWRRGQPQGPLRTDPIGARVPALIEKGSDCWAWRGDHTAHGYGRITHKGKTYRAHRVVYEHFVGPIPEGLVIDHLCRNHGCVNPAHLEPVTNRVNVVVRGRTVTAANARKTHCKRGHTFDDTNTRRRRNGSRACRRCENDRNRRARNNDEHRARHAAQERARRARVKTSR